MNVLFSKKAECDLEEIGDFIAKDSPERAISFIRELRAQCQILEKYPESFRSVEGLGDNARIMPFKNYVILYRILQDAVSIERILHGARDIMGIFGP